MFINREASAPAPEPVAPVINYSAAPPEAMSCSFCQCFLDIIKNLFPSFCDSGR